MQVFQDFWKRLSEKDISNSGVPRIKISETGVFNRTAINGSNENYRY